MKICPRCQKTYGDDSLNFCLEDGSVLTVATAGQIMPETLVMNEPRITQRQPPPSGTSTSSPPPNWQQLPQQHSMQPPKKSSKTWIWVVGIFGVLILLCGGGFVGFFLWIASQKNMVSDAVYNAERTSSPTPISSKSPTTLSTTASSTSVRTQVTPIDLYMFADETSTFGINEMDGDDLIMGSRQKGFYYVLLAPKENTTENADTRVTLRNIDDASSRLGYGIVFHSKPQPLQQDYAFLIDTKRKKYRVVYHRPQEETAVKAWTTSPAIKGGTEENTLEVRDQSDKIELYINGTMVTSIENIHGYSGGVVGLYSGDGVKTAFKNLEIRR